MVCRRVYVENYVVIPPRHQVTAPARSTVDNLRVCSDNDWLVVPKEFRPGVFLARTLLPDRHRDIVVRVVDTTNEPHELPKDFCLGDLSQAEELGAEPLAPSTGPGAEGQPKTEAEVKVKPLEGDESDPVAELTKALPPELNEEQRAKAIDLLQRLKSVFSHGEFDLMQCWVIIVPRDLWLNAVFKLWILGKSLNVCVPVTDVRGTVRHVCSYCAISFSSASNLFCDNLGYRGLVG